MKLEEFEAARPPYTVRYWADGQSLGQREFREQPWGMECSEYFICPFCYDVWGMVEYPNRSWYQRYVPCLSCGKPERLAQIPGSMLPVADVVTREALDELPREVLTRECQVYLNYYTKELV